MPGHRAKSKYAKSTLGAVAARNTKAANAAKKLVAEFKSNVANILKEGYTDSKLSNIQRQKILKDIEKVQEDSSEILTALYEYSEELREKNVGAPDAQESFMLYDSLLDEFKQHMGKIDDLHSRLVNYQKSLTNSITDIKHHMTKTWSSPRTRCSARCKRTRTRSTEYPLETNILDERSQQIKELRSSVYGRPQRTAGINDMYIEIGDMVDYQGDQLDNIENNMLNAVFDSQTANQDLRAVSRRAGNSKATMYVVCLLLFCTLVVTVVYKKLSS